MQAYSAEIAQSILERDRLQRIGQSAMQPISWHIESVGVGQFYKDGTEQKNHTLTVQFPEHTVVYRTTRR